MEQTQVENKTSGKHSRMKNCAVNRGKQEDGHLQRGTKLFIETMWFSTIKCKNPLSFSSFSVVSGPIWVTLETSDLE